MKRIATVEGYWSTNIGNSFFQLVAQEVLKDLDYEVVIVPDVPGYINVSKGNPQGYFEILDNLDIDYLCVHGPIFRREFAELNYQLLKRISERGIGIIGLGIGCMHYENNDLLLYEKFIKELNWCFVSTRDQPTYDMLKGKIDDVRLNNGLDLGFYLSNYFPQPRLTNEGNFVVFNFDQTLEPVLKKEESGVIVLENDNYSIQGRMIKEPQGILKKLYPFVRPYFKTFGNTHIGKFEIIRTDHRYNPYSRRKIYGDANGFASDTPSGYLTIYANAHLTLSNRVHANVATLSYGNLAMYLSTSKRAALLDRAGLSQIYNKPMRVDRTMLKEELEQMKSKLYSLTRL